MEERDSTGLICYSIKDINNVNLEKLADFKVRKDGGFLANYLAYRLSSGEICSPALAEERANKARTYLVEDKDTGELIAYFTLKAGSVGFKKNRSYLSRTFDSMSGIEVANLAVNEIYKQAHNGVKGLGFMVFRDFILPKVEEVQRIVGVEILYIYALSQPTLIENYKGYGFTKLAPFQQKYIEKRFRPKYDRGCIFMYQNL